MHDMINNRFVVDKLELRRSSGVMMAAKEEECDSVSTVENNDVDVENDNDNSRGRSRSIAERRAARCGFDASKMNAARLVAPAPAHDCFTVPPGLSPSALLDSPVMLPNAQAQLSPTTGTFHMPSPNHDTLNGAMDTQTCSPSENKPLEYPRNLPEMRQKECFGDMSSRNQMTFEHEVVVMNPNLDRHQHQHQHQYQIKSKEANKNLEDGFNWRKYGQKHVKGSEYPRSYYKCTSSNCPVTKKVERSHDGLITEVVYKGSHNHAQPQPFKCMQDQEIGDAGLMYIKTETKDISSESRPNVCSSFLNKFSHDPTSRSFQPVEADDRNEASSDSVSLSVEDDENGDQYEASRRKRESFPNERCTREPKVVVQIESDIDILDDGYRWRKYGQKVVKGNPNPRSYYKCTTPGCPVRKHVERAAENIKFVVTTYEGKHNHELPSSKSGISEVANQLPPQKPAGDAAGKQQQIQEMYLDRKPVLNYKYNELMRSNLGGRASSLYSLPLPSFHSLPVLNSYHNHPMMPAPDYLAMPSPHIAASSTAATRYHVPHHSHDGNHHIRPWTWSRGQEVKHKEEQMKDEDEVLMYDDAILSVPNLQGYGTI